MNTKAVTWEKLTGLYLAAEQRYELAERERWEAEAARTMDAWHRLWEKANLAPLAASIDPGNAFVVVVDGHSFRKVQFDGREYWEASVPCERCGQPRLAQTPRDNAVLLIASAILERTPAREAHPFYGTEHTCKVEVESEWLRVRSDSAAGRLLKVLCELVEEEVYGDS